jgi:hypothetical protein
MKSAAADRALRLSAGPSRMALLLLCLAASSESVFAADEWTIGGSFNQSVEISDNRALSQQSAGETYGFISQLLLDAIRQGDSSRFEFDANISYRNLEGPGADDNASPMDNGLRFMFEQSIDPTVKYNFGAGWRRQDATSAQLSDTGSVIVGGDINTFTLDGGITRKLGPTDDVHFSLHGTRVDFSSATNNSYSDLIAAADWSRRLSPRLAWVMTSEFEWLARDDSVEPDIFIGRFKTGLNFQFSRALSAVGNVGVGLRGGGLQNSNDVNVDWLGDLQFLYVPRATTQFAVSLAHTVTPDVLGDVQSRSVLGASVHQAINRASGVTLRADYSVATQGQGIDRGNVDYFRTAISYDYRITREWVAQASYSFAERADDTGTANSNTVYLSAIREFVILP